MGQLCGKTRRNSSDSKDGTYKQVQDKSTPIKKGTALKGTLGYSWEQCLSKPVKLDRSAINKKDFWIRDRDNDLIIRRPGQVSGEQFIIENCTNCDFYILDHSDAVTVDDCKNCRFFFGPIMSSIFIRNCEECKFGAIACQQFRTRDCKDMDVLLYSQTRPIIETTTNIRLGCFDGYYIELFNQFSFARLSVFNNIWSVIHDFTPNSAGLNYSILPIETTYTQFMKPISEVCPDILSEEQERELRSERQLLVPLTLCANTALKETKRAIIFLPGYTGDAFQFTRFFYTSEEAKTFKAVLARCKEWKFSEYDAKAMFKRNDSPKIQKATKNIPSGASIVMMVSAPAVDELLARCLANVNSDAYYVTTTDEESNDLLAYVFTIHRSDVN